MSQYNMSKMTVTKFCIALLISAIVYTLNTAPGGIQDAIVSDDLVELEKALEGGASPDVPVEGYNCALLYSVYNKKDAMTRMLIKYGADVNKSGRMLQTPLHYAATPEMIQLLISAGAKVNAKDCYGRTPLDYALRDSTRSRLVSVYRNAGGWATNQ